LASEIISILKSLILPPIGPIIICLIAIVFKRYFPKLSHLLLASGLIILYISSTPLFPYLISIPLGSIPEHNIAQNLKGSEAIVILGGGIRPQAVEFGKKDTIQGHALSRLRYGAYLHHSSNLPILVSGGRTKTKTSEAAAMADYLIKETNTPVKWMETESINTRQNAENTWDIMNKEGIKTIVLVTNSYHMRRATLEFTKVGFNVLQAPTIFQTNSNISIWSFLPSAGGISATNRYLHEWVGIGWHYIR